MEWKLTTLIREFENAESEIGNIELCYELLEVRKVRTLYLVIVSTVLESEMLCLGQDKSRAIAYFGAIRHHLVTPCTLFDCREAIKVFD